jgi:hypothetical protein
METSLGGGDLAEEADATGGALVPRRQALVGERVPALAEALEMLPAADTMQAQPVCPLTKPGQLCLTLLVEVVTNLHVLPEILHGTGNPTTGLIETNHDLKQ